MPILGGGLIRRASASYDADAMTLFAAMSTQPDAARKSAINTLITSLKTAGVWAKLDELWILAAHAEQAALLGWKRYKDCVAVNAPTFEADRGFAGNGTTSYLNTQYVPSVDGVQYRLNDASFGVYSRTDIAANVIDMGARDSNNYIDSILKRYSDDKAYGRINSSDDAGITVATSLGLTVARRTGSTAKSVWRNGTSLGTASTASTGLPALALHVCRYNYSTPLYSTRQYAAAFVGGAMTEQQQADFYTHLQSYLATLGAQV